ncbi:MAG: FkbM family methyltransferase [Promethearchaeota archaeon]
MTKFYSQYGQDVLLNEIFKEKTNGIFVEVGCLDGRQFSNTLMFEEKGWKGLCIEANVKFINHLKKNRPNSIICHCAAGDSDKNNVFFYANKLGILSTLNSSLEDFFRITYRDLFFGFEKQLVNKRRLDSLFKEYNITKIDILSIDVEGTEFDVLKGIDFNIFKPRVILIESVKRDERKKIFKLLKFKGYKKSIFLKGDTFYVANKLDHKKIYNKRYKVILHHTKNPFTNNNDKKIVTIIDTTRFSSIKNRLLHILEFVKNIIKSKLGFILN